MTNKPDLLLGFADTFENCERFFTDILSRRYNVIRDDERPHYAIIGDPNFGETHHKWDSSIVAKILYTGENYRPTYFNYDYAIGFDFINSPYHYRLPLYTLEMWAIVNDNKLTHDMDFLNKIHTEIDWEKAFDEASPGFTYIQSNPNCIPRNNMVENLMRNFEVLCGGPHFNNIGYVIPRDRKLKIDFLKKKRMNIAFENGSHPGYVTEKILDAFTAGVMPFYWGSNQIGRDFNRDCFIDATVDPFGGSVGRCRTVMNDKRLWCNMMAQPRFPMGIPTAYANIENFLDWFDMCVYMGY